MTGQRSVKPVRFFVRLEKWLGKLQISLELFGSVNSLRCNAQESEWLVLLATGIERNGCWMVDAGQAGCVKSTVECSTAVVQ